MCVCLRFACAVWAAGVFAPGEVRVGKGLVTLPDRAVSNGPIIIIVNYWYLSRCDVPNVAFSCRLVGMMYGGAAMHTRFIFTSAKSDSLEGQ